LLFKLETWVLETNYLVPLWNYHNINRCGTLPACLFPMNTKQYTPQTEDFK